MLSKTRLFVLLWGLAACTSDPTVLTFVVDGDTRPIVERALEDLESPSIAVSDQPTAAGGVRIAMAINSACDECYRIEATAEGFRITGGARTGLTYGITAMLEAAGLRFFHPWKTFIPERLNQPQLANLGQTITPEMKRRGFQLHTLHPIEAYYAFWEPSEAHLDQVRRIANWTVRNRGNFIQWVALDNIQSDTTAYQSWKSHTQKALEILHTRGIDAGLGIQLFGNSNLQLAFDLLEGGEADPAQAVRDRLTTVVEDLPFDLITVSFGEFFTADAQSFVDTLNLVYQQLQTLAPGIETAAVIHVGEDVKVQFQGEELLYYFLVKFADQAIIPWVHTVMYYNLFQDAGGAYGHHDFAEHRQFLFDQLAVGREVAYQPETAYWVAFDNSVPTYLPLYVRSRWLDLDTIRQRAAKPLTRHVLFTTGWEWGYWQNDVAALRMSHTLPARWQDSFDEMFSPWGAAGKQLSTHISAVAELQNTYLIEKRLAAYLAGRDVFIDAGEQLGIIAQPDRVAFDELLQGDNAVRDAFRPILADITKFAEAMDGLATAIATVRFSEGQHWADEIHDGCLVTAHRARFVQALYQAVLDQADGKPVDLTPAQAALDQARVVVDRRHGALYYPDAERLLSEGINATLYQFGYLQKADQLCYWQRELVQATNLLEGTNKVVPPCAF